MPLFDCNHLHARTKKRKKIHTPRTSSFQNHPIPAAMVKRLRKDLDNSLIRMRLSGINGKDLGVLVACFGQAWLLTEHMDNAQGLKLQIEQGVADLTKLLTAEERTLSQEAFDLLYGLIDLTMRIVEVSTKNEYAVASKKLESIGSVEFVDNFLLEMAKAKFLEVVD